nr:RecName: Full=Fibrinogen alpha chain; Contains: RecName: Full=Fibrinopeptide A [Cavia porcellus]prf//650771H fibrinopeptide A [Cavia porcellus]
TDTEFEAAGGGVR